LTKSKRPRDITFVDELPRTSVGKIRKFLLRDPAAESTPGTNPSEMTKEVHA
jgi:crotonobetaine/carnitine-CoA ligase